MKIVEVFDQPKSGEFVCTWIFNRKIWCSKFIRNEEALIVEIVNEDDDLKYISTGDIPYQKSKDWKYFVIEADNENK